MNDKDRRLLLVLVGAGLIAGGHKLLNVELGELGAPARGRRKSDGARPSKLGRQLPRSDGPDAAAHQDTPIAIPHGKLTLIENPTAANAWATGCSAVFSVLAMLLSRAAARLLQPATLRGHGLAGA